jgi:hypothetical protein
MKVLSMIGVLKKQEGKTSFIPCLTIETKWPFIKKGRVHFILLFRFF